MIDWKSYRALFPHTNDQLYLNHAAIAPMNTRAQQAIMQFMNFRLYEHVEFWPEALERKAYFVELIAKLLHVHKDSIALTSNTSAGLNILALGLPWKTGDRILLNNFEFPSNVIPFQNLQRLGVEIDFVTHRNGKIDLDDVKKNIHPRTKILSISFVEFLNGYRNDMKALGKICRENDIIFSVDAIQGLGALDLNARETGIDFLSSGGHKWLMWPAGLGFIYISPRIFKRVHPAQAGWMSLETPFDFFNYNQPLAANAQRFEPGVFSTISIMGATATLEMMLEIGLNNIEDKILNNTRFLLDELSYHGYKLFTDPAPENRSGIVTFYHPAAEEVFNYFKENRVTVSLREGMIRISPHFYHDQADLERFIKMLTEFKF
jgi:selenocysteine lyase/cysteine desulfurase